MKSAIETRALEIANHIRMEKGNAEDAFLEATARCRFAHSQGDFATTSLYQRAGSLIAELGGITLERIKEILPEPSKDESGDQISIPTDLRGILKNNSTGRWACDHVGIQSDGKSVQAMATDGAMLAIVDQGMLHAESLPAGETLVSKNNLPTKIRDRKATMPAVADQPEAGTAQLPPIDGIVPSSDKYHRRLRW